MKKYVILFIVIMLISIIVTSCTEEVINEEQEEISNTANESVQTAESLNYDDDEINQTFADWVLGTEYGIQEVKLDIQGNKIEIIISEDNYVKLADYDFVDIKESIDDILSLYKISDGISITFSNGSILDASTKKPQEPESDNEQEQEETDTQINTRSDTINLIFIHHSVGENWLNAGLNTMLNDNNFHVADTYYGWNEMGDRTDTTDWPDWFSDDVMPSVYNEFGNMTGYNAIEPAPGENTIIMFKSCYPNSDVGNSIEDEKLLYISLLPYFEVHSDKMFVLVTPPPMQNISHPDKTRELTNWLVADGGWRKDYAGSNLFVFDFYNVLTAQDNHHMLVNETEAHIINDSSNTLYYDSAGDDHPNDEGSLKAAEEFVPILMYWYGMFAN